MIDPNDQFADDIPMPPEEDLEIGYEEVTGKPFPGNPAERVVALTKRVAYLEDQLRGLAGEDGSEKVAQDLADARKQLIYWRTLDQGRN